MRPMALLRTISRMGIVGLLLALLCVASAMAQSSPPENPQPVAPAQTSSSPPPAAAPAPQSQPQTPANQAGPDQKSGNPKSGAPQFDAPKSETPKSEPPKSDAPKPEPQAAAPPKVDPATPPAPDTSIEDEITKFKIGSNEVNVVFNVTDKHGKQIIDLKQTDFRVLDDNRPVEQIRSFRAESNLPLLVGLLIDASNSVRDRFKFEQESAVEFLNQTIRFRYDHAFVVGFDATPEITQDFTDNTEALAHGVRELRPGGGTAMFDAIYYACRERLLKSSRAVPQRRAIILLSDGEDNLSHVTREDAIEMAQRAETVVYTISTNISGVKGQGDKVLERIADATGGRAFFPFQIRDVANDFAEIQAELRSQYAVSYKPGDFKADGHYRTIEIVANDRKNLHVRSRRGYYAPTQ
jgi:Ca-activated chloride channel family protein